MMKVKLPFTQEEAQELFDKLIKEKKDLKSELNRYKKALELACEEVEELNGCEIAGEYNDNNRDEDERSNCDHCAFADADMAKECLIDYFLAEADKEIK